MQIHVSGHQVDVTPPLRDYVVGKFDRIVRHFDQLIDVHVVLSVEKLKHQGLVRVAREGTYLRYTASTEALQELLGFLYAECCTRNKAIRPGAITKSCK